MVQAALGPGGSLSGSVGDSFLSPWEMCHSEDALDVGVSSGSHTAPGLGWDWGLQAMLCFPNMWEIYNCPVSSVHRGHEVNDSF